MNADAAGWRGVALFAVSFNSLPIILSDSEGAWCFKTIPLQWIQV